MERKTGFITGADAVAYGADITDSDGLTAAVEEATARERAARGEMAGLRNDTVAAAAAAARVEKKS